MDERTLEILFAQPSFDAAPLAEKSKVIRDRIGAARSGKRTFTDVEVIRIARACLPRDAAADDVIRVCARVVELNVEKCRGRMDGVLASIKLMLGASVGNGGAR